MRYSEEAGRYSKDVRLYARHRHIGSDASLRYNGIVDGLSDDGQNDAMFNEAQAHDGAASYDEKVNKKYTTIVFDLGNTLIRFDHNISAGKIANLFHLDSKAIYEAFFDSNLTRAFEKGEISPKEFHKRASALLGVKMPFKDFVDIWNDIFWEDEEACELARELKKSYRLFLLSNVNRLHFEYIQKKFDIIKLFDQIILSFMVGAQKPDRIIFEDVIKRSGGDRTKILYIDDREDLVKEALSLGIDSVRYEGADKLKKVMAEKGII